MSTKNVTRRDFLKQAAAVSAGIALPGVWTPSNAATPRPRKISASEKVNLACIGIGQRGGEITKQLYATGLCNIVAICDTDMGGKQTEEIMNMFPNAKRFQDFRKMLDTMGSQIDAVTVGVPDHSHFPITMEAMAHGKHVYVEKPLARTFQECEILMAAEKKYGVVTQMGNQGHSEDNYYQFRAWKDAGIIKNVTAITAHMNNARRWHNWDPKMQSYPAAEAIPSTLDWDTWLGVVHHHDYQKDFVGGQWRCWFDFGMGALGDWGAHLFDAPLQFLELGLPTEVDPTYLKDHNPFFYPMSTTLKFKFPARKDMPECVITWQDGLDNIPAVPEGYGVSEIDPNVPAVNGGTLQPAKLNPGKLIYTDDLIFKGASHGSALSLIPSEKASDIEKDLPEWEKNMPNHYANFLLACKGEATPNSPFSVSGPLSQVFCLGVLAQRFGSKIVFDPATKKITNNPLADIMLRGDAPRPGWEQYYKI